MSVENPNLSSFALSLMLQLCDSYLKPHSQTPRVNCVCFAWLAGLTESRNIWSKCVPQNDAIFFCKNISVWFFFKLFIWAHATTPAPPSNPHFSLLSSFSLWASFIFAKLFLQPSLHEQLSCLKTNPSNVHQRGPDAIPRCVGILFRLQKRCRRGCI